MNLVFDCEIIGDKSPVFFLGVKEVGTDQTWQFWGHKKADLKRLEKLILEGHTWISFNGINFDQPLICALLQGATIPWIKAAAQRIIETGMNSWQTYKELGIDFIEFDHIDLREVAPGVMISLKTYAGRMGHKTMVDLPFHHNKDLTPKEQKVLAQYCLHDLEVTEALYETVKERITLRENMSCVYNVDLRSKSDAQMAEAILKKRLGLRSSEKEIPVFIRYKAPNFIKTKNLQLQQLINALEATPFKINRANGSPIAAEWMEGVFELNDGTYQVGLGGLHSTHDTKLHLEAAEGMLISDFDVASYYPNIMMKAGLIPRLPGNKGQAFIDTYKEIYEQRIEAKRNGDKITDKSLKILLNGTYGKLGNLYCSFYSPDLMLAVTFTGQLNLLCLIDELERIPKVKVISANTDGIMLHYPESKRERILKTIAANSKRTGFEYEETPYRRIAMKDVNNYIAVKTNGEVKRKGLYAIAGVDEMKNPTMEVCSNAAAAYLAEGTDIDKFIKASKDMQDFVAIRNVKGGGVQHLRYETCNDWEEIEDRLWLSPRTDKKEKRKSRPKPLQVGVGGTPFGRVARWYMTKENLPPITYVESGNMVPKTEGGKLCLTLPDRIPEDLDYDWYINETKEMLSVMGVAL